LQGLSDLAADATVDQDCALAFFARALVDRYSGGAKGHAVGLLDAQACQALAKFTSPSGPYGAWLFPPIQHFERGRD
jgi:hypothetical protein